MSIAQKIEIIKVIGFNDPVFLNDAVLFD